MDVNEVWRTVDAERAALADLLETLSPQDWKQASLCAGWTVRDVAAHVISSPQATPASVTLAMLRARGNFNRCMYDSAKRLAARPVEQIVADYRRLAGSRRHPLGTSPLDPMLDVLVHTQDIAIPLGRSRVMPAHAARAGAERVWRVKFPFRARRKLAGFQLSATDIPWTVGAGPSIEGPIEAILLLLTGRTASLPRLGGAGAMQLRDRLAVAS